MGSEFLKFIASPGRPGGNRQEKAPGWLAGGFKDCYFEGLPAGCTLLGAAGGAAMLAPPVEGLYPSGALW